MISTSRGSFSMLLNSVSLILVPVCLYDQFAWPRDMWSRLFMTCTIHSYLWKYFTVSLKAIRFSRFGSHFDRMTQLCRCYTNRIPRYFLRWIIFTVQSYMTTTFSLKSFFLVINPNQHSLGQAPICLCYNPALCGPTQVRFRDLTAKDLRIISENLVII